MASVIAYIGLVSHYICWQNIREIEILVRDMHFIYAISRTSDGRVLYIGQTIDPVARAKKHFTSITKPKLTITHAMRKYADEEFCFEVVECHTTQEAADEAEVRLIQSLKTHLNDGGYNVSVGGKIMTEETISKMSASLRGKPLSKAHREKLSKLLSGTRLGEENPFYGKRHSAEARKKMSERQAGANHPRFGAEVLPETRAKISAAARKRFADRRAVIGLFAAVRLLKST